MKAHLAVLILLLGLPASAQPQPADLLITLRRAGPCGVYALAKTAARNYSNVHADVSRLEELGLIDRAEDGSLLVPYDSVEILVPPAQVASARPAEQPRLTASSVAAPDCPTAAARPASRPSCRARASRRDDFGAGFAGLTLLADFTPDIIKLDMALVRDVDTRKSRQAIARGVLRMCQ